MYWDSMVTGSAQVSHPYWKSGRGGLTGINSMEGKKIHISNLLQILSACSKRFWNRHNFLNFEILGLATVNQISFHFPIKGYWRSHIKGRWIFPAVHFKYILCLVRCIEIQWLLALPKFHILPECQLLNYCHPFFSKYFLSLFFSDDGLEQWIIKPIKQQTAPPFLVLRR